MIDVIIPVLTMLGLGLAAAILLAVASRVFFVKENPMVVAALEILPGANCGGCGFAGCEGYAKAVVNDPEIPANRCCACSKDAIVALGNLTGKTVAEAEPLIAMRRCDVYHGYVARRYEYQGIPSCAAASLLRGGSNACVYSCLGLGDCEQACPFAAMHVVDGLACVDASRCTGCGICVKTCPRDVLELIPLRSRVCLPCNTRLKAKAVMEVCSVGCVKCGKCVRVCPVKAVTMENDRIAIDQEACLSYEHCDMPCVRGCARHILRPIDLRGVPDGSPITLPPMEKPEKPAKPVRPAKPAARTAPAATAVKTAPAAGAAGADAPAAPVAAPAPAPVADTAKTEAPAAARTAAEPVPAPDLAKPADSGADKGE